MALLKRVEREIEEMERDYAKYVDDGQGSLISTDRLTPIYQFGKPEPTGYIDDATHRFWCVEQDEMRSPQYEDAVVCYEEC